MTINKYIKKTALFAVVACGIACTGNYEDVNTNPYDATNDDMNKDGYIVNSKVVILQSNVVPLEVHTFQFTDCLLGGPFGGYLADSGSWAYRISMYNPTDDWMYPSFKTIIPNVFSNYTKVVSATKDPVILSVVKVLRVAALHRVTDVYGPIPYSKVGVDGELTAPYDTQKEIYTEMFKELDDAIAVLKENVSNNFTEKADEVYGGNVQKWIVYANSLKLRMAMRIVYAEPALAQAKAEEAAPQAMSSNADNAFMKVSQNPFRTALYEYNDGESRISADIASYMNGYQDPRRASYFTKSTSAPANDGFNGLRSGIPNDAVNNSLYYSNMVVETSTPLMWMNASEVAFLKAEGALRGWNMGGSAQSFYERGIELSFERCGVQGASTYKTNAVLQPIAYVDPKGRTAYNGEKPSTVTVAWNDADDLEKNLERIITQKWIANFPLGQEAWAEYRRTGYPNLLPSPTASGMGVLLGKMPARLPYPQDEYTLNKNNYLQAVSALTGPDNMATRLWWDCKNKKN